MKDKSVPAAVQGFCPKTLSLDFVKIFLVPSKQELIKKAFKPVSHFWLLAELLLQSCSPLYPRLQADIDFSLSFS